MTDMQALPPDFDPAHESPLRVCGEVHRVHRSFDLIRRIEERLGPVGVLVANLRASNVRADDLVWLIRVMARDGDNDRLLRHEVEDWIEDKGPVAAVGAVFDIVLALFSGNEAAASLFQPAGESDRPPADAVPAT